MSQHLFTQSYANHSRPTYEWVLVHVYHIYTHPHTNTHTMCIHTCIYTHTHTHTYTYIYTPTHKHAHNAPTLVPADLCEWVMSHMQMSHSAYILYTYTDTFTHKMSGLIPCEWVMSHMQMSHGAYIFYTCIDTFTHRMSGLIPCDMPRLQESNNPFVCVAWLIRI